MPLTERMLAVLAWWRALRAKLGRKGLVALGVGIALAGAVVWAGTSTVPAWSISPGVAQPVSGANGLIRLPARLEYATKGKVLLTDVELQHLTGLGWLANRLGGHARLLPPSAVLGPTPPSQFDTIEAQQMAASQKSAILAALRQAGRDVPFHEEPVVIGVAPGTGAARLMSQGKLHLGDALVAVDGHATATTAAVEKALQGRKPSTVVTISLRSGEGAPTRSYRLRLSNDKGRAVVGVELLQEPVYSSPFPVSIDTRGIGGPSAGLAFALGIDDELMHGKLSRGRTLAATGTLSATGQVGPIGGLPEKTIAVERAGASVFLVPESQVSQAKHAADSHLEVVGVSSLAQAVKALEQGGRQ